MTVRFHWQTQTSDQRIRAPKYADDLWYSSITPQLLQDVQAYLDEVPPALGSKTVRGLIVPHGGYLFSGHVAAAAYNSLKAAHFDTVILLGPDMSRTTQAISVLEADIWNTPLGDIAVDWQMLNTIAETVDLERLSTDHEHALEIQLPFLQYTLKSFKLVPLMVNTLTPQRCQQLAQAIAKVATESTLLVAASDLSRYHDMQTAQQLDDCAKQSISAWHIEAMLAHATAAADSRKSNLSSGGAIATLMYACETLLSQPQATLMSYATTADVHPIRKEQVIGYAAFVVGDAVR